MRLVELSYNLHVEVGTYKKNNYKGIYSSNTYVCDRTLKPMPGT